MMTRHLAPWLGMLLLSLDLTACKDLAGNPPLPAGTINPSIVKTAAGATATAVATRFAFQSALVAFIPQAGMLTDELQAAAQGPTPLQGYGDPDVQVDARVLDQGYDWSPDGADPSTDQVYNDLQSVRTLGGQAIGGLAAYAPTTSANARGELYALVGYAEVMLADLFCSGIPLSTLDYQGNYTYQPGATTAQVYEHAIALFDTAMTLAADSAPIVNLAKVGQGRAYLALGQYATAGQVVNGVPPTFQYVDSVLSCFPISQCDNILEAAGSPANNALRLGDIAFVSDREGGTGLPFRSSHDPRTASDSIGTDTLQQTPNSIINTFFFPHKYAKSSVNAIVVASGTEAQLITAEAQLNGGNASGAFGILNALRTGNLLTVGQLPPLTDPGAFNAEVDSLFTERAAWLFADGHRQGDLRRLVREYENGQGVTVVANQYPSGMYPGLGAYGTSIDASIPAAELANPLFTGCLSRD